MITEAENFSGTVMSFDGNTLKIRHKWWSPDRSKTSSVPRSAIMRVDVQRSILSPFGKITLIVSGQSEPIKFMFLSGKNFHALADRLRGSEDFQAA